MPQASFLISPPSHVHFLCSVIPTPQKGNKGVKDRPTIVVTSEHNISVRVWLRSYTILLNLFFNLSKAVEALEERGNYEC
jgi:hypothetical protein